MTEEVSRFGLEARLRDEPAAVEAYVTAHAAVWPEVLADARAAGAHVTCIFRSGTQLFMYLEARAGFDLASYGAQLSSPRTLEWQLNMDELLEDQPGSVPGLKWKPMELVVIAR